VPLYEYQCPKCGHRFERIQKFSDPDPKKCPKCGAGKPKRQLTAAAVQFKGTGWYITDYARKGSGEPAKKEGAGAGAESSTAKDAESKPKPEAKAEPKKKR
jgi:putative FmdB family regulatory protein